MKSLAWTSLSFIACLAACSSSSSSPVTVADSGSDAKITKSDAGDAGTKTDAKSDAKADTSVTETGPGPGIDAGVDAPVGADAPVMDAPFDATGFVAEDGGNSAVLTQPTPETWTWVPFPESSCRDGSTTGIGINFNPASPNLVIYLEGGGACFNSLSCDENPSSFGASDFPMRFPSNDAGVPADGNGILDRDNAANPVADWNFVYVPYCTGDIHAGNNPTATISGVTGTKFVGYQNVELFLQRIVPTFSQATQVLLTGVSGGGFGAAANYLHVRRAFGSVPVSLIDDSGPAMEDPYLTTCLQSENRAIWGLDSTVGADCAGHCNDPASFFLDYAKYAATLYPDQAVGLMDSTDDEVITQYFGFGAENCTTAFPMALSASTFTAGLLDFRTQLAGQPNVASFYFTGTDHTSLGDGNYYTRTAGSTLLTTWVGSILTNTATNAGP